MTRKTKTTNFFEKRSTLIWIVIVIAVVARVTVLALSRDTFLWNGIWSDAATYNQWARGIVAEKDWIGQEPFFMSPLYSYFLAIVYSLFGESLTAVRVVQAAAGSGIAVLIFLIGERLFTRQAAFASGLLAAIYGPFLLSGTLLLVETLKVFLLVLTLWLLLEAERKGRLWRWILPGVSLGLATLCRPTDLMILVVVGSWILLQRVGKKEKLSRLGFLFLGVVLVIAPVTLRNYLVSGDFILVSSNGGLNLYLGNNPDAVGIYYNVDRLDLINDPDGRVFLETEGGKEISPADASSIWTSRALGFMIDRPASFVSLLGKKLLLFFHYKEISQLGYNYVFVGTFALPLLRFLPSFLLIGPLGILGCVLARRKWRALFFVYGFLAAEILAVILFFVTDRFRLSAVPFLILFAGFAIVEVTDQLRRRDWRKLKLTGSILLGTSMVMTILNVEIPDEFSMEWEQVGVMHFEAKNHTAALQAFQESGKYKDSYHLRNNIGNVYAALGQADAALSQFAAGEVLNPAQPVSSFGIGTVLAGKQEWDAALESLNRAIRINPRFPPAHLNKGLVLYYMQRFDEALLELQTYAELEPDKSKLATVRGDIRNLEGLVNQQRKEGKTTQ